MIVYLKERERYEKYRYINNQGTSAYSEILESIEDSNIRIESADNLADYETLNPGVVII